MARFLITGGAGFLGRNLRQALQTDGHEVATLDTVKNGNDDDMFIGDVCEPLHIDGRYDWIVHLASIPSPTQYYGREVQTIRVNAMGTFHALDLAVRKGAKFMLASTSEVYGDPKEHPQREMYFGTADPIGERAHYYESKRLAETMTVAYGRERNLDYRIARIFNSYGEGMEWDDGRIMPELMRAALKREDFKLYGDGSHKRSFCYVTDTTEGMRRMMMQPLDGEDRVINLGNTHEISIRSLIIRAKQISGVDFEVVNVPARANEPARRCPDISKARGLLGWTPKICLDDGMERMLDDFSQRMD